MTEIPRRTLLTALALGLTAVAGCGSGPQRTLTIAAGEPGGLYLSFAELLATAISDEEPRLVTKVIPTEGSLDNLQRLGAGEVDLALVLTDAAQAATSTGGPLAAPVPMFAIGRVYENYLQLVVLADGPIHTLADLAGRTVSLGADRSGAKLTGGRLLTVAGLTPSTPPAAVIVQHYPLSDAITALEAGRIDALLWSGGVPTPALAELSARRGIRLLPPSSSTHAASSRPQEFPCTPARSPPTAPHMVDRPRVGRHSEPNGGFSPCVGRHSEPNGGFSHRVGGRGV